MLLDGVLEGDTVILKNLSKTNCTAEYVSWMSDSTTNKYMETRWGTQDAYSIYQFINAINKSDNSYLFGIFIKESGKHIGNIKIGPIDFNNNYADISYFIGDKKSRGKGYAKDAIATVCSFGFNTLNLHKIYAGVIKGNDASMYVLNSCGFFMECTISAKYLVDGYYTDAIIFSKMMD